MPYDGVSGAQIEGARGMANANTRGRSGTPAEPIYEQLLREADEGIRSSVLAGQSSQPGAHYEPSAQPTGWSSTQGRRRDDSPSRP